MSLFLFTFVTILCYIYRCHSQACSCAANGPEFSISYSRSTTKQIQDAAFVDVFQGPMYCTNYILEDVSSDNSCGNQNSLNYIVIPTTSDCLSTQFKQAGFMIPEFK